MRRGARCALCSVLCPTKLRPRGGVRAAGPAELASGAGPLGEHRMRYLMQCWALGGKCTPRTWRGRPLGAGWGVGLTPERCSACFAALCSECELALDVYAQLLQEGCTPNMVRGPVPFFPNE